MTTAKRFEWVKQAYYAGNYWAASGHLMYISKIKRKEYICEMLRDKKYTGHPTTREYLAFLVDSL